MEKNLKYYNYLKRYYPKAKNFSNNLEPIRNGTLFNDNINNKIYAAIQEMYALALVEAENDLNQLPEDYIKIAKATSFKAWIITELILNGYSFNKIEAILNYYKFHARATEVNFNAISQFAYKGEPSTNSKYINLIFDNYNLKTQSNEYSLLNDLCQLPYIRALIGYYSFNCKNTSDYYSIILSLQKEINKRMNVIKNADIITADLMQKYCNQGYSWSQAGLEFNLTGDTARHIVSRYLSKYKTE